MKLLIINVFFLLIALKAFAVPGGHYSESTSWGACKLEKNGLFKLEKGCKTLQICYKSKLATGTSKFGGQFRLGKRVNERPLCDCAGVVARKEWHALNVSKISDRIFTIQSSLGLDGQFTSVFHIKPNDFIEAMNISKDFGPIETDFLKALHLGAFMKDFDGMAFRIMALDLLSSIGQNGTGLCKKTCAFEPTTLKEDHFGTNCTEIVFPAEVPKFVLNVLASPYLLVCDEHEFDIDSVEQLPAGYIENQYQDYVNACMQVPTEKCQFHVEVYACYKSTNKWPGNSSIAELCREHLGVDSTSNVAGFPSPTRHAITGSMQTFPIFFIEFGNGPQQSAIRQKSGGETMNGSNWNIDNDGIGSVLNEIEQEKINGTWAKKLHFVPPSTDRMEIYFQIANPEFSKLITRSSHLKSYENYPNRSTPTPCEVYGNDCEEIREILKRIEDLESCHKNRPALPDDAFKLPPWKNPPAASPFNSFKKRSESLRCHGGDVPCNKESLHKEYIEARKTCRLVPEEGNRRKKRQYLPEENNTKWTEFPIKIGFREKDLPKPYTAWKTAIKEAFNLIMKETCVRFKIIGKQPHSSSLMGGWQELKLGIRNPLCQQLNKSVAAAHELLHALGLWHKFERSDARNFTIIRGDNGGLQFDAIGTPAFAEIGTPGLARYLCGVKWLNFTGAGY
uniref:Peptidase metallopeptidase domain-containing protein n=1 Tax=Globodera rostochiensis TaxID=31243 RepID=A0A914I3B3_GLORO